jgi:hypothetical protein
MRNGMHTLETLPTTIDGLMHLALSQQLTHLLIHPSSRLVFRREDTQALLDASKWDVGPSGKYIASQKQGRWKGYVTSIVGRSLIPRPTKNTRLIFIEQSNWPLNTATPDELLSIAATIEEKLGVSFAGSPTSVGLRYLEQMNKRYYEHYFEKSDKVDWEELKFAHIPIHIWFPPLTTSKRYLHCFDRNSSHPFAASTENMGVGEPAYHENRQFSLKEDRNRPALWNASITGNVDPLLPPLVPIGCEWLPTSILRIAAMAGYSIQVHAALIWPKGKPVFERWAKNLWALREQYPDGSMMKQSFKSIMNNPIGATRVGRDMDVTLRPDWYALIVGSERAIVWYKAWKIAKEYGVYPIGTYADGLFYLSDEQEPQRAVPTLMNPRALGGYKHVWTLPVDARVQSILKATMGEANRIGELKKIVKGRQ